MNPRPQRPVGPRRLVVSLVCAVAAGVSAGLAFFGGAAALGVTAVVAAAVSLVLAAIQFHSLRHDPDPESTEVITPSTAVTVDLRTSVSPVDAPYAGFLADTPYPGSRSSTEDPVTGLVDRTYFRVALSQRVASARRHLQPLSLVVFELDGFERAEPEQRDQALRLLGSALRRTLRQSDTACRYGNTAVAALLEDTPDTGAVSAVERLRRSVTLSPSGRLFTLSAGIACYPSHALDAHELLRRSVQALATARAGGRDRVEIAGGDG